MTRVFGFIRTSPQTINDGKLQETKILVLCKLLMKSGIVTNFGTDDRIDLFQDEGTARTELRKSTVVGGLFEAINSSQKDEQIFVLISQLDRLGTDYDDIAWFLDAIYGIHSNITIHSMNEFGLDLYKVGWSLSHYHGTKRCEKKEQHDETKMMADNADKDTRDLQDAVDAATLLTMKTWKKVLPNEVTKLVLPKMGDCPGKATLSCEILKSIERISNNDEISRVVGDMVRALDVSINAKREDEILIYVRTSPRPKTIRSEEVVPLNQVAMCKAASEHVLMNGAIKSIICDAEVNNATICRDGILLLFNELFCGTAKHLVIKTTDRISRINSSLWDLLIAVCERVSVSICVACHIGIPIRELIQMDIDRRTSDATALASHKDYINAMYSKMDNGKRVFAEKIVTWASAITGENFSRKYKMQRKSK